MRRFTILVLLLSLLLCFGGCKPKDTPYTEKQFYTMDAFAFVRVVNGAEKQDRLDSVLHECVSYADRLYQLWDVDDPASELAKLNNASGAAQSLSPETLDLLTIGTTVGNRTDGALDITVLPLMKLWGFGTNKASVPSLGQLNGTLAKVDYNNVVVTGQVGALRNGAQVDPAVLAKGYTAQGIQRILVENGIANALINVDGNIVAMGVRADGAPWRVAITDPEDNAKQIAVIPLKDRAVATSSIYRHNFQKDGETYHHLLNPKTGMPVNNGLLSVSVICKDAVLADGLATALFIMGEEEAREFLSTKKDTEAIFIRADHTVGITQGLSGNITLTENTSYRFDSVR